MFDFLFSNPIIIIILIGVISSLLKKKNKPNQQKLGQPQAPKPIWKEIIQEIQEELLEEKKKTPKTIQEARSVQQDPSTKLEEEGEGKRIAELRRLQQEYEEKYTYDVEPNSHSVPVFSTPAKVMVAPVASMISDEKSPIYNTKPSFAKQELINGIIMSEILAPPRSKRSLKQSR